MMNPRPVMSMRKTVQLLVILTLLAWATQTLFAQWGYGGLILANDPSSSIAPEQPQRDGATLEVRDRIEPTADGTVTLRDVCRWSDRDANVLGPLADIVLARLSEAGRARKITVNDIRSALGDAGANLTTVHFTGSATCMIGTANATEETEKDASRAGEAETKDPFAPQPVVAEETPTTQPFHEEPVVFEEQLVLTRPLSKGQRLIASDIATKRVQIAAPSTQPAEAVTKDDLVGQLAARNMKAGDVLDADAVTSPPLVNKGEFMTVSLKIGATEVETVARAMETAPKGGVVRAKNEANGDVYRVVVTGPNVGQQAGADGDVATVSPEP
jgi:flagella basal body P-ring formation protein FlgA